MSAPVVHLRDIEQRGKFFTIWEKQRNKREVHWFVECFAEALGVFFYVYAGIGSGAGWTVGNITGQIGLSSLLQIGLAYAFGILFAIGVCGSTSGGHFNPCMTVCFVIFKGFPPLKGLRYITAQLLGSYIACLLLYNQWKPLIDNCENILRAKGTLETLQFTPNGPAGIFGLYLLPGMTFPRVFLNEFTSDVFLGIIVWASIDPSNAAIPPVLAPFIIAVAYASAIWGFATPGAALNSARDIGGRLLAMTIWGREASGGRYAALAGLTNIPATLFGVFLYEFFLKDSDRVVPPASLESIRVTTNHRRLQKAKRESRRQSQRSVVGLQRNTLEMEVPIGENKPGFTYAITTP